MTQSAEFAPGDSNPLIPDKVAKANLLTDNAEKEYVIRDSGDNAPERLPGTFYSDDPVRAYLRTIGTHALLNAEEEVTLSKQIEAGQLAARVLMARSGQTSNMAETAMADDSSLDHALQRFIDVSDEDLVLVQTDGKEAFDAMINANLRLVVSIAKKYTASELPFLDLIQEGNLGLHRAVEKFDYAKGFKFSTYATWWIRQAITRGIADTERTIRIPVHMTEVINRANKVKRQLTEVLGRVPSNAEIAKELGKTEKQVDELMMYNRKPMSIDEPLGDSGSPGRGEKSFSLADMSLGNEAYRQMHDEVEIRMLRDTLYSILDTLSQREADVIIMRYGLDGQEPMTLDAIGKVQGCTRERARQIEYKAIHRLRGLPNIDKLLKDFLN